MKEKKMNYTPKAVFTSIKKQFESRSFKATMLTIHIVFSVLILCFSVWLFWNSYHSIDMAQNVRYLNAKYNLTLGDTVLSGEFYEDVEMYQLGIKQNILAFLGLAYSVSYFTLAVTRLHDLAVKQDGKKP